MPRSNKILIRSGTVAPTASDFAVGEPAFDKTAGKFYVKNAAGSMVEIGAGAGGGTTELVYTYATTAALPATGSASLLYFATDTGRMYRWVDSTTKYVEVGSLGGGGLTWTTVPAARNSAGAAGSVAYGSDGYFYVATADSTWKRVAVAGWSDDPYAAYVRLLLHCEGANNGTTFTDSSATGHTISVSGDAVTSTAQYKFGSASGAFTAGRIQAPASSQFDLGSSNFAIEFFVRFTSVASGQRIAGGDSPTSDANFSWAMYMTSTGQLDCYLSSTGSTWNLAAPMSVGSVSTNTWYHVVLARTDSTIRTYLGGTSNASITTSAAINYNNANGPFFGGKSGSNFSGYIDEIRITQGSNRGYTGASITVPTAQFPDP